MAKGIRRVALAGVAAALLLAGCSKRDPEPPQEEPAFNEAVTPAEPAPPPPEPEPAPAPPPEPVTNIADLLPPDEPPAPDAQMLEDADAVGLTARATPAEPEPTEEPAANGAGADGA